MTFDLPRRLAAEAIGTALLVGTVVGSGIMADGLTDDDAVALLGNTIPTGAILVVLRPVTGARFNPAVTLAFTLRRQAHPREALGYAAAQVAGGVVGAALAHAMFELPPLQVAATVRTGAGQWLAEVVTTFGLVGTILLGVRLRPGAVLMLVGLSITAA